MAKQFANPVERHIEKGILALAGLFLIWVIARFLATSPNQIELGGETVTPATVDAKLAQRASSVRQRIRDFNPSVEVPEPLAGVFAQNVAPLSPQTLAHAVALAPDVPIIDAAQSTVRQAKLVETVRLDKPATTSGRTTFTTPGGQYIAVDWVTVASLFNVKEQSERQRLAYGPLYGEVLFGPVEIQRRVQRDNGSWSDQDWEFIQPWPAANVPSEPTIELIPREEERFDISADHMRVLEEFRVFLQHPKTRLDMLRPLMPTEVNGDPWRFPELVPYQQVLMQDDEILYPKDEPAARPEDRYGIRPASTRKEAAVVDPARHRDQLLAESDKLREEAMAERSVDKARMAYNRAAEVFTDEDATPVQKEEAQRLLRKAEQAEADIERIVRIFGQQAAAQPDQADEEDKPKREPLPVHEVWAHDARPGSITPGNVYQYRIRISVVNPLAGEPSRFADPEDATVVLVPGVWSEPTEPVLIPPAVEFYFTSTDERDHEVGVELFSWFDGVWTRARRMKFQIGEAIAGEYRHPIPALKNPNEVDNALVPVDTGAVVLDLEFDRPYRERRSGTGRDGFKIGPLSQAGSVAFLDEHGEIHERFVPVEKAHPAKQAATQRTWKPGRR